MMQWLDKAFMYIITKQTNFLNRFVHKIPVQLFIAF